MVEPVRLAETSTPSIGPSRTERTAPVSADAAAAGCCAPREIRTASTPSKTTITTRNAAKAFFVMGTPGRDFLCFGRRDQLRGAIKACLYAGMGLIARGPERQLRSDKYNSHRITVIG